MAPLNFDAAQPDLAVVRQAMLSRLRDNERNPSQGWRQLENDRGEGFSPYITFDPRRHNDAEVLGVCVIDVFWEFLTQGIVAPGLNTSNPGLPWFHLTHYGRSVLTEGEYTPHDRDGYLRRLAERVQSVDGTVLAYLAESLETFTRGNLVASMVMLGVAAERVFDLLCESIVPVLQDPKEAATFSALLDRYAMKPKVDWVHDKLRRVYESKPRPAGFPENANLAVTAIYDLIRSQRNDLGHPSDQPPRLSRGDAHANLLIFPRYYETAEALRRFLVGNRI